MSFNKIRIERLENGYVVRESGFGKNIFLTSHKGYLLERNGRCMVCMECTYTDYMRIGSKEKDVSETVREIKGDKNTADRALYALIRSKAEELARIRGKGYTLEDRTGEQKI